MTSSALRSYRKISLTRWPAACQRRMCCLSVLPDSQPGRDQVGIDEQRAARLGGKKPAGEGRLAGPIRARADDDLAHHGHAQTSSA